MSEEVKQRLKKYQRNYLGAITSAYCLLLCAFFTSCKNEKKIDLQ